MPPDVAPGAAVAPTTTPTAPAAAPAPAATVQPVAKPSKPETIHDAMIRLGGYDPPAPEITAEAAAAPDAAEVPETAESNAAPEAAPAPAPDPKPAKGKGKKTKAQAAPPPEEPAAPAVAEAASPPSPAVTAADRMAQLNALAQELGLTIDASAVLTKERAAFREQKRKLDAQIKEREQTLGSQLEQRLREIEEPIKFRNQMNDAVKRGDADAIGKLLGSENWEKFQEHLVRVTSDPHYQELQEVRREMEAEKAQRKAEQEATAARAEQARRQAETQKYVGYVQQQVGNSRDAQLRQLAEDPILINSLIGIQRANWDPTHGRTVTLEQAFDMVPPGGNMTVRKSMQRAYQAMHKAFGGSSAPAPAAHAAAAPAPSPAATPAAAPAPNTNKPGAKPRPKTAIVPAKATPAPSLPAKLSQAEWMKYQRARLAEAAEHDRQSGDRY